MSCNFLTAGYPRGCRDNTGGLKRVFLANKAMIDSIGPSIADDVVGISAMTMLTNPLLPGPPATGYTFYEFVPNKLSSNITENVQANTQNGSIGYEQVLTLMFAKNTATLRNQVKLMGQQELVAISEDYNGTFHYLGEFNGLELNGGNSSTGTALSDMNGWTITLNGWEPNPARTITLAAVQSVVPVGTSFV